VAPTHTQDGGELPAAALAPRATMLMMSLTTIQRDLLALLLQADQPLSAGALGQQLQLSAHQVHYSLREIKSWLGRRQIGLRNTRGVGIQLLCSHERRRSLLAELSSQPAFQLIVSAGQRQQLLAFQLLTACEPKTLGRFQNDLAVARATVLKDLDAVAPWLRQFGLLIARRQHRGVWLEGPELAQRQALAALLWGDVPFDKPLLAVRPGQGIVFELAQDAGLLPLAGAVNRLLAALDLARAHALVAQFEEELGGCFAEEAVDELALALAIQQQRVGRGQSVAWGTAELAWITAQALWPLARSLGAGLWPQLAERARDAESAALAVQLMARPRHEPWRSALGADPLFRGLIEGQLRAIAESYAVPALAHDQLLRDGLEALLLPAWVRRRFSLWTPQRDLAAAHDDRYAAERALAAQIVAAVASATGTALPADAEDELVLLLRAAVVRSRPERTRRVIVVCPSGMATTQLLVARLRARLPRLGTIEVLPIRALDAERVAAADLIISTVPLSLPADLPIPVVQVHPMLNSEDITALSQWMT
jgi:mannitol operon transcriptional antiterminator